MKPTTVLISILGILVLSPALTGPSSSGQTSKPAASLADSHAVVKSLAKLPLYFEANQGQSDPQVKFVSRRGRFAAFLTADGAVVALQRTKPSATGDVPQARKAVFSAGRKDSTSLPPAVFRMKLLGANASTEIEGVDELPGKTNFLIGNDPKKWRTNVSNYARVRYHSVYNGVDLFFYGHEQQLEYDFVVAPGAGPRAIQLSFDGAKSLQVDRGGNLVLNLGSEEVTFHKPMVYQPAAGANATVDVLDGRFVVQRGNRVTFSVSNFDPRRRLIIDPTLSYSTYLGGSSGDEGIGIAVDSAKNAYVTGATFSLDFPLTAGAYQSVNNTKGSPPTGGLEITYITKLNPSGTQLIYSTLLGGVQGCGSLADASSVPTAIAVDGAGNAYVSGSGYTRDFPITPGAWITNANFGNQACVSLSFLTKVNTSGSGLVYSTYLPSTPYGLAVDSSGNAYFVADAGQPTPGAFQTTCPLNASFHPLTCPAVTKLNAAGSAQVYTTLLGGSGRVDGSNTEGDHAKAIAVDSSGSAYVAGAAGSTDFPVTAGAFQTSNHSTVPTPNGSASNAFVSKLSPDGSSLVFSTYLGGSAEDWASAIAVDSNLNVIVAGSNGSSDFPVTPGVFQTQTSGTGAFVAKLNPTGTGLVYSGLIPGGGAPSGLAVDAAGDAFVTGESGGNLPQVNPLQPPVGSGAIYVSEINGTGTAFIFFLSVSNLNSASSRAGGIAVDSIGDVYITGSADGGWPTTPGVFQSNFAGGCCPALDGDAYVTKITGTQVPGVLPSPASLTFAPQPIGTSTSQTITLSSSGNQPLTIGAIIITGDYSQTNTCPLAPSTLAVGASCVVTVTFQPRGTGTRTGDVGITDNAWNGPQGVHLSGGGTSGAAQLSATTLTFGTQHVASTSAPQAVTLTNTGTLPLLISNLAATGDFAQTNTCPGSLPAAANCTISVTFTPIVNGVRTGNVTITDTDPTGAQVMSLSGTGSGPVVTLAPASLAFGNQNLNGTSPSQLVTLSNVGDGPLVVSVSVSGQFSQTNTCGTSLAAGASCSISVAFAPTTAGMQTGAVTITDNAASSPHTINLSGIGIAPFSISGSSTTQTVTAGQTASYPLSVTPNNFSGMVTLSCNNPPPMATCSVSTPSVSLTGTASVPVSVSETTTARSGGVLRIGDRKIFPVLPAPSWMCLLCALLLAYAATLFARRAPRLRVAFGGATLGLILLTGLAACGGGGSSTAPSLPPTNAGTPAGTYTVTVSGNAQGTTQSVNLQVVVQ